MIRNEQIEALLIDEVKLEKYITELERRFEQVRFDTRDFKRIDEFIIKYFSDKIDPLEVLLIRAYFYGEHLAKNPDKIIKELPSVNSTTQYQEALSYIKTRGAFHIQSATDQTKSQTREIVYKGLERRVSWRVIAKELEESIKEGGDINRFWERVAISEVSAAINNGYLANMSKGEFVIGTGYPDACQHCKDLIIGKVYQVNEPPKYNFEDLDPLSQAYKDLVEYWEKYVWVGKSNFGRAPGEKKRVEGGYETRLRHEVYFPTIPLHPSCRCRWNRIVPNLVFADKNGNFIPRKGNEEAHKKWFDQQIKSRYPEAA